jgi:hypothetical protein
MIKKPVVKQDRNIPELKVLLNELKNYYSNLTSKYSLKNDLVEVTNRKYALTKTFNEHIDKLNLSLKDVEKLKLRLTTDIDSIIDFQKNIEQINELLNQLNEDEKKYSEELKELLNPDNIKKLQEYSKNIIDNWEELNNTEDELTILEKIKEQNIEINNLYSNIFTHNDNEELSKKEKLDNYFDEIINAHSKIITGYTKKNEEDEEIEISSYLQQIKLQKDELNIFYKKIFGTEENKGLKQELEERTQELKTIEKDAKEVINLSSDAGLAGGFTQRGDKARTNKYISLGVFVFALVLLGIFNFSTIDFKNLHEITIQSIVIRIIINTPFLWIAIVSNINLNKYSRLEEEYAHKESLAKSFERYKEQIENLDNETSSELMVTLLKTNLEAFEKNPAETMIHAKSDMPSSMINAKIKDENK